MREKRPWKFKIYKEGLVWKLKAGTAPPLYFSFYFFDQAVRSMNFLAKYGTRVFR